MVRIAVLVSGGGTNLQALIDAQNRGEIQGGAIAAVISSSPDAFALERAKQAGIPGYVVARKDYPSAQAMTVALVEQLRALDIGLVVLAGFMTIITEEMVRAYPNAILNIHPALIPSFCGQGYYGLHVWNTASKSLAPRCISSLRNVTPAPSYCKRPYRWRRAILRKCSRDGSWSRRSG